jgi:hypothetical protein
MSRQIPTIALVQVAAVLAALSAVLVLAVADRPSQQGPRVPGIERLKSLIDVQVESISSRR